VTRVKIARLVYSRIIESPSARNHPEIAEKQLELNVKGQKAA
jgi:hypothetical protein